MDLLAEYGLKLYLPSVPGRPAAAGPRQAGTAISLPYSPEVNDAVSYKSYLMSPRRDGDILKIQFDQAAAEGAASGGVICSPLHAYLVGHPRRVGRFDDALKYIASHEGVWVTAAREIADFYYERYYADICKLLGMTQGEARP